MSKCGMKVLRAALGCVLLGMTGCGRHEEPEPEAVRPVRVFRVGEPVMERVREFAGTVRPEVSTEISFRVPGEIVELPIRPGQAVARGDLLARLDSADYELQVKQAEAEWSQARSALDQARANYERVSELYETDSASKSDLDNARAAYESADAGHVAMLRSLELAQRRLGYCALEAPFDGTVVARPVDIRQTVNTGQPVVTLASGAAMQMVVGVPETLINQVDVGDEARVRFDALDGAVFEARVAEVGFDAAVGGTYPVKLAIHGDTARLRPGMVGEAFKAFGEGGQGVLLVPAASVAGNPDGSRHVWVVTGAKTLERRLVTVGALTSNGLEIRSGLAPGELVVTHGVHRVSDGLVVRILE